MQHDPPGQGLCRVHILLATWCNSTLRKQTITNSQRRLAGPVPAWLGHNDMDDVPFCPRGLEYNCINCPFSASDAFFNQTSLSLSQSLSCSFSLGFLFFLLVVCLNSVIFASQSDICWELHQAQPGFNYKSHLAPPPRSHRSTPAVTCTRKNTPTRKKDTGTYTCCLSGHHRNRLPTTSWHPEETPATHRCKHKEKVGNVRGSVQG